MKLRQSDMQIVTSSVFFLSDQQQCSRNPITDANITEATILFHANTLERKLRPCYCQASYTVVKNKKSNVYDDGLIWHQESKILPAFYLIPIKTCQSVKAGNKFKLPGFESEEFQLRSTEIKKRTGQDPKSSDFLLLNLITRKRAWHRLCSPCGTEYNTKRHYRWICVNQWKTNDRQAVRHEGNARGGFVSSPGRVPLGNFIHAPIN